jgi:hypothetical protein
LYRHQDGDPDWTLKDIAGGIRAADKVRPAQIRRWADPRYDYLPARMLADCILAASISWSGAAIRVDVDEVGDTKDTGTLAIDAQPLGPSHSGNQADLEWADVVDIRHKSVTVCAGCGMAEDLMAAGPQVPEVQLETLYEEYRPSVRRRIRARVRALVNLYWAINPAPVQAQNQAAARRAKWS